MPAATTTASATLSAQPPVVGSAVLSASANVAGFQYSAYSPPEVYTPRFVTSLTAAIPTALRPTTISVAATQAVFGSGTFSISVYDTGTDANPTNFEAFEVISGGTTLNWYVVTESGWSPIPHANGSTVIATVLTPRSITQPLNNHTSTLATPDPHPSYMRKSSFSNKGDLVVGAGGSGQYLTLPAAADGQILLTDSTRPVGMRWTPFNLSTVLQHMGDLIVGGLFGVAQRLGVGASGQVLTTSPNAVVIANPVTLPIVTAAVTTGSLINGVGYDFAYAWQTAAASPDGGITVPSPITQFTATATGAVQVQAPSSPAGGASLVVYAAIHGGLLTQQVVLTPASTTSANIVTVSSLSTNAPASTVNTTGGLGPTWRVLGSVDLPQNPVLSGEVAAADFRANGLLGTTAQARFAGGTFTGPPTFGTWQAGDFVVDRTGKMQVCITPGTPGAWIPGSFVFATANCAATTSLSATPVLQVFGPSGPTHSAGLVVDPGSTFGVSRFLREDASWQTPTGGGGGGGGGSGGSIVPIQTQTLTSPASSIIFPVPTGFRNLRLTWQCRYDQSATGTLGIQFNGDTGANYDWGIVGFTSGPGSTSATGSVPTAVRLCILPGTAVTANEFASGVIHIPNHTSTTQHKQWSATGTRADLSGGEGAAGTWHSTAAITSVAILPNAGNFIVGSTATLWGESDTAPVLLTTNSNLISETILTSTTASVTINPIPQGYRDLRINFLLRTDQGAQTIINMFANGDTTTGHYTGQATAGRIGVVASAGQTAGQLTPGIILLPGYSDNITVHTFTGWMFRPDGSWEADNTQWAPTAATGVTSLVIQPATGNFVAGSEIRVYGEPAASGGPSVGTGTRIRISTNQSIASGSAQVVTWDTDDVDADNQHYTIATALSGTVAKTAGSQTLTGTSSFFTTELNVGQVISVPGVATEQVVVIAIASNTSATVAPAFANTASAQLATRLNTAVVFRQPGMWSIELGAYMAAVSTGTVTLQVRLNGATVIGQTDKTGINAAAGYDLVVQRQFQQWDYVEVLLTQGTGSAVNLTSDERTHLAVQSRPTVIVAIPYVNIQDQKASGTAGGTFTSGAWQTRTLTTIVSDNAGISSLASNQITLPPGTYRIRAEAPAFQVAWHQARIQNVTDSVTLLLGMNAYNNAGAAYAATNAVVSGKFVLTGTKAISVQHQCNTTSATQGFGIATSWGTEVYTNVEIWKEG